MTKFCHIKRDRLVNFFYISLEKISHKKSQYFCNGMTNVNEFWQDDAECLSSAQAVKKFKFKDPKWQTANMLERSILHHHEISQLLDFQNGSCPPSWIFKIKIFNSHTL